MFISAFRGTVDQLDHYKYVTSLGKLDEFSHINLGRKRGGEMVFSARHRVQLILLFSSCDVHFFIDMESH